MSPTAARQCYIERVPGQHRLIACSKKLFQTSVKIAVYNRKVIQRPFKEKHCNRSPNPVQKHNNEHKNVWNTSGSFTILHPTSYPKGADIRDDDPNRLPLDLRLAVEYTGKSGTSVFFQQFKLLTSGFRRGICDLHRVPYGTSLTRLLEWIVIRIIPYWTSYFTL